MEEIRDALQSIGTSVRVWGSSRGPQSDIACKDQWSGAWGYTCRDWCLEDIKGTLQSIGTRAGGMGYIKRTSIGTTGGGLGVQCPYSYRDWCRGEWGDEGDLGAICSL